MHVDYTEADEESFEDNPEEYIRRDMEGSDVDTRRRAACDLVRALSKSFEGPVITNFSQYVDTMLTVSIPFLSSLRIIKKNLLLISKNIVGPTSLLHILISQGDCHCNFQSGIK